MRAGLYLRISNDPTGREAGVTRQGEDCAELAEQLSAEIVERYVDNDVSATSGKPRPAYRRMLEDVAAGRLDLILAWHPDRLYRRTADLTELIQVIERNGVLIFTCRAGEMDLSNPTGRMVARILGAVAEQEVEHKADRWRRSVLQNRRAGKWSNARHRLYGYDRTGRIVPDESDRVRWAADQILSGRSLAGICRELNGDGATTSSGRPWSTKTLRHLMLNPRIAGFATHHPKGGEREIIGPGDWSPILEPERWERVTAALHPYRQRGPAAAILTRLVWCHCGAMMHSGVRSNRHGDGRRMYHCPTAPRYRTGCGRLTIAAVPLERYVIGYAKGKLADRAFVAAVESRRADNGKVAEFRAQLDRLDGRFRELEAELRSTSGRAATAIAAAMDAVDAEARGVRDRLDASFTPAAPDIRGDWPASIEAQNALIGVTLERVIILPNPPPGGRVFNPARIRIVPVDEH